MFKRSEKGFFGTYVHRDENNNITGTSEPNPLFRKEMIHKDTSGKVTGKSTPDFGGGFVHYDESGNKSTAALNTDYSLPNYLPGLYNDNCIFGRNRSTVSSTTMCMGCRYKINQKLNSLTT